MDPRPSNGVLELIRGPGRWGFDQQEGWPIVAMLALGVPPLACTAHEPRGAGGVVTLREIDDSTGRGARFIGFAIAMFFVGLLLVLASAGFADWRAAAVLLGLAVASAALGRWRGFVGGRTLELDTTTSTATLRWRRPGHAISASCVLSAVRLAVHRVELFDPHRPLLAWRLQSTANLEPLYTGWIALAFVDDLWLVLAITDDLGSARAAAQRVKDRVRAVQLDIDPTVTVRGYFPRPIGYRKPAAPDVP